MKAKAFLSQAYTMNQQIDSKLDQIQTMRSLACRVTTVLDKNPVRHSRNVTGMQDVITQIVEAEDELNADIDRLVSVRKEIADVIGQLESERYRLILEKRYLCFQAWDDIGHDLNICVRWAQAQHNEAVQQIQEILDERESKKNF